ncbi:hypothetical protein AVEN_188597-1 [Araneus ventricosus]|uniref:Uncharacterized protein n=1 Tax=Araneus ventricosus TaxID=182803 RepID=A0A4Y2NRV4_ARAVE|nr:hypothetical protein AVEN_188597-1 [Araneus ventricosus]
MFPGFSGNSRKGKKGGKSETLDAMKLAIASTGVARWPDGKILASWLEDSRFETKFHPLCGHTKSYVEIKRLPAGVVRKLGEGAPAQALCSRFDRCSK